MSHTWICSNCADLHRIKAPLREWEARGLVTFVDAPEIPPDLPVTWLVNEAARLRAEILLVGLDDYSLKQSFRATADFAHGTADRGGEADALVVLVAKQG